MPRFTVELKVTLDMYIEMASEEAARTNVRALHDDIAFQAEEALCARPILRKIGDKIETYTGWVSSASTLSAEAIKPRAKYLIALQEARDKAAEKSIDIEEEVAKALRDEPTHAI